MLFAILALFALQYAGPLVAGVQQVPIPGTVIGLVLLLVGLAIRSRWPGPRQAVPDALHGVAGALHGHLGLLFVPAGVGVVENINRPRADGPVLVGVVLLSTATAVAVTAVIMAGARLASRTEPVCAE